MRNKINIAIDGHSSCGKSTLARDIAKKMSYIYIDSGAMYRAVALYIIQNDININDNEELTTALDNIHIDINYPDGSFQILLNEKDITKRIIAIDVSNIVSEVASKSMVRKKLVDLQQSLGQQKGVVMDGRDIATVVFPDAEVKLFVTANLDVRTTRRHKELSQKGMPTEYEEVKKNLHHRDHIDSTRDDSPLRQADDALLIDNSYMDREEQLFIAQKIIEDVLQS